MSLMGLCCSAGRVCVDCLRKSVGDACEFCWGVNLCGQVTKGMRGMSWCWKAKKGVEGCEKPGGAVKRALIPGFPNYRILNP